MRPHYRLDGLLRLLSTLRRELCGGHTRQDLPRQFEVVEVEAKLLRLDADINPRVGQLRQEAGRVCQCPRDRRRAPAVVGQTCQPSAGTGRYRTAPPQPRLRRRSARRAAERASSLVLQRRGQ